MSDTPENISPLESGIIVKQLAVIVVSISSLAGIYFSPEQTVEITSIITAFVTIGLSMWTIHNRISKPCPPIQPKEN